MINLGLMDIILLVILVLALVYSNRRKTMTPFYVVLALLVMIEFERLFPGLFPAVVRGVDAINAQLPHVQISPIITIK
ncbi:MAG: hypothetical protein HY868_25755 [Chloroflexi bacterium]|nr:hypothetical protein [Chloroflexota bacterium]